MIFWPNQREAEPKHTVDERNTALDAELVRAARHGDKRAFVEIVVRYQSMVCGIALGVVVNFAASEDTAQEAFLTAWRKLHELREPEKLRSWLGQIARNEALAYLRRNRRYSALEDASAVSDQSPPPDQIVANEEEAALVCDALSNLPETYRLPLILFYREGKSVRVVAEALAISEDAVKQRLARGREMLRDQMSGLVESVLTRSGPTAVFMISVATALGALVAPAAVASGVFATASTTTASTTASGVSNHILTCMSTTKTSVIVGALVAAICFPIGHHLATKDNRAPASGQALPVATAKTNNAQRTRVVSPESAIFAEWRRLHDLYGTNAEAMPLIYEGIAALDDPALKLAFHSALIAEWAQVDGAGGLEFFLRQRDMSRYRQLFRQWLGLDAQAAVDAVFASGSGWEEFVYSLLRDIARSAPDRLPEIIERLPKQKYAGELRIREAYAIVAENGLTQARKAAEAMTGPNREQALAGVAQAWGKSDFGAALAWAKALPQDVDREEMIRAALVGRAKVDPVGALDHIGIVPPGGKDNYSASTTGGRVLRAAAEADFDATVSWIAAHPGRLGHDDMMGIAGAVTDRLNTDAVGFLNRHAADNSLAALGPAIHSAILNGASGQRNVIWEWLKNQPVDDFTRNLRDQLMKITARQDPFSALQFAADSAGAPGHENDIKEVARYLFESNAGELLHRFDSILEEAPSALRPALIESAFNCLRDDTLTDPQAWAARLPEVPEKARPAAIERLARTWGAQAPQEAIDWARSLPAGQTRTAAIAAIAWIWGREDVNEAMAWVSSMPSGAERDRSAASLARAIADGYPRHAWAWALSIADEEERIRSAMETVTLIAAQDSAAARELIDTASLPPDLKQKLHAALLDAQSSIP